MRVLVCGAGAVGARAARHLVADADVEAVLVDERDPQRRAAVVASLGSRATGVDAPDPRDVDVVLLASPAVRHAAVARAAVSAGRPR